MACISPPPSWYRQSDIPAFYLEWLMDRLKEYGYGQYWIVTITPYGRNIEPQVPPKEKVMADFRRLSDAALVK